MKNTIFCCAQLVTQSQNKNKYWKITLFTYFKLETYRKGRVLT